jgi:hypothetical protein
VFWGKIWKFVVWMGVRSAIGLFVFVVFEVMCLVKKKKFFFNGLLKTM